MDGENESCECWPINAGELTQVCHVVAPRPNPGEYEESSPRTALLKTRGQVTVCDFAGNGAGGIGGQVEINTENNAPAPAPGYWTYICQLGLDGNPARIDLMPDLR